MASRLRNQTIIQDVLTYPILREDFYTTDNLIVIQLLAKRISYAPYDFFSKLKFINENLSKKQKILKKNYIHYVL